MMIRATLVVATLALLTATAAHAAPILDFQDVSIPGGTDAVLFSYSSQGFSLSATSGFAAHGNNSVFYAGSQALAGFSGENITLARAGGLSFAVTSIDLARNFAFDPTPTVTFTGTKAAGGTVTQSFTVTTPVGQQAFQSFTFAGFTDLVSLQWDQPQVAAGLHQFDNIALDVPAVPEPVSVTLLALGLAGMASRRWRQRRG